MRIEKLQISLDVADLKASDVEVMVDLLILNRQHEIYVRKLLGNLKFVKSLIEMRVKSYAEKLAKLHDIVQFRSAVPSVQIFPKFKELSEEWMALHNLSFVLSQQSQINNYLQHLSELCRQQQFDEIVHKLLAENAVETDHTRLQKRRHLKLSEQEEEEEDEATSSVQHVAIVQPPESNCEVKMKNIFFLESFYDCIFTNSTLARLNTWAFVRSCSRRAEFYCQAFPKWEPFCGIRKFMAFTASKLLSCSCCNQKSE